MSYNGGNVMENKNLQRYEEQGNGCENIIDELIIKTYLNIFSENKKCRDRHNKHYRVFVISTPALLANRYYSLVD